MISSLWDDFYSFSKFQTLTSPFRFDQRKSDAAFNKKCIHILFHLMIGTVQIWYLCWFKFNMDQILFFEYHIGFVNHHYLESYLFSYAFYLKVYSNEITFGNQILTCNYQWHNFKGHDFFHLGIYNITWTQNFSNLAN